MINEHLEAFEHSVFVSLWIWACSDIKALTQRAVVIYSFSCQLLWSEIRHFSWVHL